MFYIPLNPHTQEKGNRNTIAVNTTAHATQHGQGLFLAAVWGSALRLVRVVNHRAAAHARPDASAAVAHRGRHADSGVARDLAVAVHPNAHTHRADAGAHACSHADV